jgi:hypothetical protein
MYVIVGCVVLLFVYCPHFCFNSRFLKYLIKGYYVLELFIGIGNRDIMTKELLQICHIFWAALSEYFILHRANYSTLFLKIKDRFV